MLGWAFGEISAIREIFGGGQSPHGSISSVHGQGLLLLGWLGAWTAAGCFFGYLWMWNLAGGERVVLGPRTLAVKRDVLGFGPLKEYELQEVRNLRAGADALNRNGQMSPFSLLNGGTISFDYGAKTFRFGADLDEAEARQIITQLKSRYTFGSSPDH